MFGEFSTGQVRTTFAAVPKRGGVVAAKITVLCGITTVLAFIVSLISFLGGQAMVASRHVGLSITDHDAQIAIAAYTLVVPVCALVGMLFGALIRNATASIVAVVAFLFLLPSFFGGDKYHWVKEIGHLFPGDAEDTLTFWAQGPQPDNGKWPASHLHAWLVYAGWAVISSRGGAGGGEEAGCLSGLSSPRGCRGRERAEIRLVAELYLQTVRIRALCTRGAGSAPAPAPRSRSRRPATAAPGRRA